MDTRTLEILDFYRIRNTIAGCCMSEEGRIFLQTREPLTDKKTITLYKQLSHDWTVLANALKNSILQGWQPVFHLFSLLQTQGAALSLLEAYALGNFCVATQSVQNHIFSLKESFTIPELARICARIPNISAAQDAIFAVIDKNGQMRELGELKAIKKNISLIRSDIEKRMKMYTANSALKDVLQSDIPTIRGERQVLAVKANFKGKIRGIIHEVSQTGQTLFIEPDDVVQRNNDLIEEEYRLEREKIRILRELTTTLSAYTPDLTFAHSLMLDLDAAFAVSKWGIQNRCNFTANSLLINLVQVRHPLLQESAVPINIRFLDNQRVLILTGANTGGKTVALKTAALCVLLNQSGFPVPCAENSTLPFFDNVFADIGDEQSIDQSLSTFSGHMKNVAYITQNATEQSLVLLDELGSGTDTQEGGAIAMAVLDFLLTKKAFVLVTTHHGILKNYGFTHAECANASVEFNEETLSPSYRIVMGVPGESHALDIALKSGLPRSILQNAQEYMQNHQADVSALIKGLTQKHQELDILSAELKKREKNAEEKLQKATEKELHIQEKETELRETGLQDLNDFMSQSRRMLENLVRELREGEITKEKTRKVKEYITELEKKLVNEKKSTQKKVAGLKKAIPHIPQELVAGTEVFIQSGKGKKQRGTLVRQDKKGKWIVQAGNLKLTVENEYITAAPKNQLKPTVSIETTPADNEKPAFELRLLGMRLEQALKELEHQLDLANLHGLREFAVIHGKGNGILQQGVHDYLKNSPLIADFSFALPENGGSGKTMVKLK